MAEPDYATWLTKQQAADAIGVTTKTVERLAQDRQIQQARWRRPTGGPELAVYHPDDVARIAQERRPGLAPFVLPATADVPTNGNGQHPGQALERVTSPVTPGDDLLSPGDNLLRVLVAAAARVMSETSQTQTAAYVAKAEALAIAGVSAAELRKAVQAGEVQQRGRRYRRTDLEAL